MGVFSKLFSRKPKVTMPSDLYNDFVVDLGASTTLSEIIFIFGEPYWHDDDKDESILFYEDGTVELQFEFPGKTHLGFITILLDPIMAKTEQRGAYGVTKSWLPSNNFKPAVTPYR